MSRDLTHALLWESFDKAPDVSLTEFKKRVLCPVYVKRKLASEYSHKCRQYSKGCTDSSTTVSHVGVAGHVGLILL